MTHKPYTYLLRHAPTNKVYYGVRWKNIKLGLSAEEDLWRGYFTSSKVIKQLIKDYGVDSFTYEIRREFNSVKTARDWETKVLKRMKVTKNQDVWLNLSNNKSIFNEIGPRGALNKTWKNPIVSERNRLNKIGNNARNNECSLQKYIY